MLEMFILFFGSGFGLFIALLAWGNQIKSPHSDIMDIENEFIKNYHLTKKSFIALIREKQLTKLDNKYSFGDKMSSIFEMIEKGITDSENINTLKEFQNYHIIRYYLENLYNTKYLLSLLLAYLLIISGIFTFYYSDSAQYFIGIVILWILIILTILLIIHILENKSINYLTHIKDIITEG